jgi:hypothetical protein
MPNSESRQFIPTSFQQYPFIVKKKIPKQTIHIKQCVIRHHNWHKNSIVIIENSGKTVKKDIDYGGINKKKSNYNG